MAEISTLSLSSDANLQLYCRLESSGADSSSNGYTMASASAPSYVAAKFGNGADFELSSSQFLTNTSCPNLDITGSQTWSFWFKPESYANVRMCGIRQSVPASVKGFQWNGATDKKVYFALTGLTTNEFVGSTTLLSTGTMYHIVGVYSSTAGKLRLYIDNAKEAEVTASGTSASIENTFSIGRAGNQASEYTDGIIDDLAVFNRDLSDAEISSIYNPLPPRGGSFLLNLL